MGLCASSGKALTPEEQARMKEERTRSKELEKTLTRDNAMEQQINKLLLLGAGESGKSTLFKQMITIYGTGFSEQDRVGYTNIIYNNIISAAKTLVEQSDLLHTNFGFKTQISSSLAASKQFISDIKQEEVVNGEVARHLKSLWNDPGIRLTFENRSKYQLTDSVDYFFERLDDVARDSYIPNQQDILRSRVRTTGIVENEFIIDSNRFKMFDVGGQRNERKKWIHCFSDVTAVLFVAAMHEYDMVLYEDENTNRMSEALTLFDEICNSRWFNKTSMILFLNKKDLFMEKITKVPLTVCFPEYKGSNTFEEASAFIQDKFESMNRHPNKQIYTHITCATDTNNIRHVFNAVKDIVIRKSLAEGGLMTV